MCVRVLMHITMWMCVCVCVCARVHVHVRAPVCVEGGAE